MPDYHGCGQVLKQLCCVMVLIGGAHDTTCLTWPYLTQAVNIIAGRLTFVAVHNLRAFQESEDVQASTAYCIDEELVRPGPAVSSHGGLCCNLTSVRRPAGVPSVLQGLWSAQPGPCVQVLPENSPVAAGPSTILFPDPAGRHRSLSVLPLWYPLMQLYHKSPLVSVMHRRRRPREST